MLNQVLDEISFDINKGNFHVLLGENGAGKSTVLRILAGLEKQDGGAGSILGQEMILMSGVQKQKIGYVAETVEYDSPLLMNDFFKFYSKYFPNWNQILFDQIVMDKGLDLGKKFSKYSRGQKMQLNLLGELAKGPEILLVDEITSVLDLYSRRYFLEKLEDFRNTGGTVLLTTNIIKEVESYATDLIILKDSKKRRS